jgi:signal transduction histidine kinase
VRPLVEKLGIDKAIVVPITLRGEFLGYLAVGNTVKSPPFWEGLDQILLPLADAAALVVDSAKSYNKLRAAKEDTERILSAAPIGILTCDANGILRSVNRQMLAMFDRAPGTDLAGTSVFELGPVTRSGIDNLIMKAMEGHDAEKPDIHVVLRPDLAIYVHAKATPVKNDKGETMEILFVAMDTTSKVRLQNQLERSYEKLTQTYQELERVTKMKTQFIDIVSHELRTPLTVMRGYIDLMETEYATRLDSKFESRMKIIRANTDRLYSLVESMLDVSRLEKGSLEIHTEPVRIETLLEEVVQTRKKDAESKKQLLNLDFEGRLPLVMADRRRMKDVFSSIVDNAIKYTQEGGKVSVSARDEGKIIHVWVKDNGVGIPLENLGKIFDRFHLVTSNDLSHQVDRLGLGLPIAKGIIEAHGGKIWVESQVGKGSVFHVDLPKEQPK